MELVKQGLNYDRNYQFAVAIILILSAIALIFFVPGSSDSGALITVYVVAGLLITMAVLFIYNAARKIKPEKQPLVQYLEFNPREIVWVYSYVVQTMPFGIHFLKMNTVYFYFKNGDYTTIRVSEKVHKELMQDLKYRLPHASFGFTSEKEQLYKANPMLLYKDD